MACFFHRSARSLAFNLAVVVAMVGLFCTNATLSQAVVVDSNTACEEIVVPYGEDFYLARNIVAGDAQNKYVERLTAGRPVLYAELHDFKDTCLATSANIKTREECTAQAGICRSQTTCENGEFLGGVCEKFGTICCKPDLADNATCIRDSDCVTNTVAQYCDLASRPPRCIAKKPNGANCFHNNACTSGYCQYDDSDPERISSYGFCASGRTSKKGDGRKCDQNEECLNNNCTATQLCSGCSLEKVCMPSSACSSCRSNEQCQSGVCGRMSNGQSMCVPDWAKNTDKAPYSCVGAKWPGAPCESNNECIVGQCVVYKSPIQSKADQKICSTDPNNTKAAPNEDRCQTNASCASGYCDPATRTKAYDWGLCKPKRFNCEACSGNDQCHSGQCVGLAGRDDLCMPVGETKASFCDVRTVLDEDRDRRSGLEKYISGVADSIWTAPIIGPGTWVATIDAVGEKPVVRVATRFFSSSDFDADVRAEASRQLASGELDGIGENLAGGALVFFGPSIYNAYQGCGSVVDLSGDCLSPFSQAVFEGAGTIAVLNGVRVRDTTFTGELDEFSAPLAGNILNTVNPISAVLDPTTYLETGVNLTANAAPSTPLTTDQEIQAFTVTTTDEDAAITYNIEDILNYESENSLTAQPFNVLLENTAFFNTGVCQENDFFCN